MFTGRGRTVTFGLISLMVCISVFTGCSKPTSPGDPGSDTHGPADLPGATSEAIVASQGAVLTARGGVTAKIPPGALPADMTVSLIPVQPPAVDGSWIAAARLEPEGTILSSPATITIPLPADWGAGETPVVLEFKGDDPTNSVPTTAYARVIGTPGHYMAEILLSHFSGPVCARNCHAGTIRQILQSFSAGGCSKDSILAEVHRRYSDVPIPTEECGARSVEMVQAMLDTYFDDIGGFDADYQVPASQIQQITQAVKDGRQVVLAFKPGQWGNRGGSDHFYPTSALEYSHTAPLVLVDGQVMIANTLATGNETLIQALGGQNVVLYPFDKVNDFRKLPQGVAVEMAVCGEPGCLSDSTRNQWGLDIYHPVDGVTYLGKAWSNPWDYMTSSGSWSGIPPRGIPWSAMRIYVEKVNGLPDGLCQTTHSFVADISLNGTYSTSFQALSLIAGFGTLNDQPGYPAIAASEAPTLDESTALNYDFAEVVFNKALTGPGTYALSGEPVSPWSAVLFFTTPAVRNAEYGEPTVFVAVDGTVHLEAYTPTLGGRIKGTFTASMTGTQSIRDGDSFVDHQITGTASGSFETIMTDVSAPSIIGAADHWGPRKSLREK